MKQSWGSSERTDKKESEVFFRLMLLNDFGSCRRRPTRTQRLTHIDNMHLRCPLKWNDRKTKKGPLLFRNLPLRITARLRRHLRVFFKPADKRHIALNQAIILYFKSLQKKTLVKKKKKSIQCINYIHEGLIFIVYIYTASMLTITLVGLYVC